METTDNKVSTQIMDLKDLISGPLVATIDADSISTRRYLSYLYELAFESYDPKTGKAGKLRMLEFTYTIQDYGVPKQQHVSIPLMTLVPLPLLQVKEADFDFDIQIIDAVSTDENSTFSLKRSNNNNDDNDNNRTSEGVILRASMAASRIENSTDRKVRQGLTANMKVKVKMQQADMPGGLSNLLSLTTNNLQIKDATENSTKQKKKTATE
ncbi:MAG: DUF2589 domain-containing protein [Prevotella sp.]|nr:DUF2589 domain-containing protein [Prevotella sp.]MDE6689179.1 DUF2589 domain-containing protein [Prevotella sp.]MDE6807860.1 DUF2589 domain-containing protein [Prevotella sp.]